MRISNLVTTPPRYTPKAAGTQGTPHITKQKSGRTVFLSTWIFVTLEPYRFSALCFISLVTAILDKSVKRLFQEAPLCD